MPARIDETRVAALLQRAQREIDSGLLPSCQLALAVDGEVVVAQTLGDATPDTRYVIFSATKPMVSGAIWALMGDGRLDISARVADVVPEFGSNSKDAVTIEQVLLHTSGFPRAPLGPPEWFTRKERQQAFAQWRLNWEPGTAFEYHPTSAHWVLAEIIEAVSGEDYCDFVEERVTRPAGIPYRALGVPESEQEGIALLEIRGEPVDPDELEAAIGVRALPVTEVTPENLVRMNQPRVRELGVPGGGAIMRAAELALFYQALLHNPGGMWKPDVLADATGHVRNTLPDPWVFGIPANRTLGLLVAGDDGHSSLRHHLGRTVSPRAFGHAGAGGQIAWADPATGLSFAYVTNGLDQNILREGRRGTALSSLAAVCAPPQ